MLRVIFIVFFSVLGAIFTYAVTWIIGDIFGPLYQSEADMSRNFMIYLIATACFMVLGAFLGNGLYKKYR